MLISLVTGILWPGISSNLVVTVYDKKQQELTERLVFIVSWRSVHLRWHWLRCYWHWWRTGCKIYVDLFLLLLYWKHFEDCWWYV